MKKLFPPPAKANVGDSFEAGGRLVNGGERRGRATVKLTLRAELNDDPLVELGKIRTRVAAKRKKTFSGDVTIPAGFVPPPPGVSSEKTGLTLVACVRKRGTSGRHRCRAAKSQIMVEPLPVPPPEYTAGARTLGDPLLPQIGNGGYDAQHYDIDLSYDRPTNTFGAGTVLAMTARATQNLSEFSLDFQEFDVSAVRVNGAPAAFAYEEAAPDLGPDPVTQPMKLVVTPAAGIDEGTLFEVKVSYTVNLRGLHRPRGSEDAWASSHRSGHRMRLRVRGWRANGLAGVVPVEQLSLRQGDVRHDDHRPDRRSGVRRRRARRTPDRQRRRHDDLELERGRPDIDLSGHGHQRKLRLHGDVRERDGYRPETARLQRARSFGERGQPDRLREPDRPELRADRLLR